LTTATAICTGPERRVEREAEAAKVEEEPGGRAAARIDVGEGNRYLKGCVIGDCFFQSPYLRFM